jgi:hypothetical protein
LFRSRDIAAIVTFRRLRCIGHEMRVKTHVLSGSVSLIAPLEDQVTDGMVTVRRRVRGLDGTGSEIYATASFNISCVKLSGYTASEL